VFTAAVSTSSNRRYKQSQRDYRREKLRFHT
jgi:hypothetical protein